MQHRLELCPSRVSALTTSRFKRTPLPRSMARTRKRNSNRSVSSQRNPKPCAPSRRFAKPRPHQPQAPSKPAGPRAKAPSCATQMSPAAATQVQRWYKDSTLSPTSARGQAPPVMGPIRWNCAQTSATRQTGGTHRRRGVRAPKPASRRRSPPRPTRPSATRRCRRRQAPPQPLPAARRKGAKTTPSSTGDLRSSSDADKYPCRHEKCYFPDLSSASIRIVLSA